MFHEYMLLETSFDGECIWSLEYSSILFEKLMDSWVERWRGFPDGVWELTSLHWSGLGSGADRHNFSHCTRKKGQAWLLCIRWARNGEVTLSCPHASAPKLPDRFR